MAEESRRQQAARRAETKALNQAEKEGSVLHVYKGNEEINLFTFFVIFST